MTARQIAASGLMIALFVIASPTAIIAQPGAVPPPRDQETADCVRPVFATDQLVCNAPELRQLDNDLATARRADPVRASTWREPQTQWFFRRSRCAFQTNHSGCVRQAYLERLAVLRPALPSSRLTTATCSDPRVRRVAFEGERTLLFDPNGVVMGVALPLAKASGWRPYLSVTRSGRRLNATTVAGATLRCRLHRVR